LHSILYTPNWRGRKIKESDGIGWNGMEWSGMEWCSIVWIFKNSMEWSGT
jgi:hypothetical protein